MPGNISPISVSNNSDNPHPTSRGVLQKRGLASRDWSNAGLWAQRLAYASFSVLVILAPFRLRLLTFSRPQPPIYGDFTNFLLYASDLALLGVLGGWLVRLRTSPVRLARGPAFLWLPLAGLLFFSALSIFLSVDPWLSAYHLLRMLSLAGLAMYCVNEIDSVRQVAIPAALSIALQAPIALAQVLRQSSLGLGWLGEYNLDPAWSGVSILLRDGERWLRAYGLSDHPNILGGCLAVSMLLVAVWYVEQAHQGNWLHSAFGVAVFGLGATALLVTFSRAAWLGLTSGLLFCVATFFWRRYPERWKWIGLLAAGMLIVLPFAWSYLDLIGVRLNHAGSFDNVPVEQQAVGERLLLNHFANQAFMRASLTGVGLGALPTALHQLFPEFPLDYQPAHLVLLDVAAEAGLFAALCYLAITVAPWLALFIQHRRLAPSPGLVGSSALLLALTVVSLLDYYPWLNTAGRTWQWLAWGLWSATYLRARQDPDHG